MTCVEVENLRTGEVREYTLPVREALVAAFAQEKGDWNTWEYATRYDSVKFDEGERCVGLGDWAAFKNGV